MSDTPEPDAPTEPEPTPRDSAPDSGDGGSRRRIDPLSFAALTAVSLAVAIFLTLVIVQVFGTSEDEAVEVQDALDIDGPEAAAASTVAVGEPAPDVEFQFLGGGSGTMGALEGSPVVLNFWSSTCAPCLAEMPDFETVHQSVGDEVVFIGVDVTDTEDAGEAMVERTGVTYPNARDPRAEILAAYGGIALPRTVLVDSEGSIAAIHNGPLTAEELTASMSEAGLTA